MPLAKPAAQALAFQCMTIPDLTLSRRVFLGGVLASAAVIAAHAQAPAGSSPPDTRRKSAAPRILSLELLTAAPLARMREFYHQALGLRVLEEQAGRLTIAAGETRLTFVPAEPATGEPFYPFAFNIPENKVLAARNWQKDRSPLLPIPAGLRDPAFPDDVVDYRHWNAHSVFFLDPGGNVVEYIGRHDLRNAAPGPFTSADILHASEIAWVVDDVPATAAKLKAVAGVSQYKGGSDQFAALGDEHGLLLVMKRGRVLNFNQASDAKAARVFRTRATVRGEQPARHEFPGFPYEVTVAG
jgi:catechol 2,3-dioxygenase-like lactoylglutathione lyase family enzyme